MKKLLFTPTFLVAFTLLFFSCSSKDEINELENSKLSSQKFVQDQGHKLRIYLGTQTTKQFKAKTKSRAIYGAYAMGKNYVMHGKYTHHESGPYDEPAYYSVDYYNSDLFYVTPGGVKLYGNSIALTFNIPPYIVIDGVTYWFHYADLRLYYSRFYLKHNGQDYYEKRYGASYASKSPIIYLDAITPNLTNRIGSIRTDLVYRPYKVGQGGPIRPEEL